MRKAKITHTHTYRSHATYIAQYNASTRPQSWARHRGKAESEGCQRRLLWPSRLPTSVLPNPSCVKTRHTEPLSPKLSRWESVLPIFESRLGDMGESCGCCVVWKTSPSTGSLSTSSHRRVTRYFSTRASMPVSARPCFGVSHGVEHKGAV